MKTKVPHENIYNKFSSLYTLETTIQFPKMYVTQKICKQNYEL